MKPDENDFDDAIVSVPDLAIAIRRAPKWCERRGAIVCPYCRNTRGMPTQEGRGHTEMFCFACFSGFGSFWHPASGGQTVYYSFPLEKDG